MNRSYEADLDKITQLDSLLDAVAETYEKATPEERQNLSPFFKMFHDLMRADTQAPDIEGGLQ